MQGERVDPVQAVHEAAPVALADDQGAGAAGPFLVADQAVHEQGVAAGEGVRLGGVPLGGGGAEAGAQHLGDEFGAEQVEPDVLVVRLAGEFDLEQRVDRGHGLARAEDGEHAGAPGAADQVEQELQGLRVGVLPVVDGDQDGGAFGQAADQPEQALQDALGELSGGAVGGGGDGSGDRALGEQGLGGGGLLGGEVGALEELPGQAEREFAFERRAGADQDLDAALGGGVGEGVEQVAAAAADGAVQHDDAPGAGRAAVQGVVQPPVLGLAADGRGSRRIVRIVRRGHGKGGIRSPGAGRTGGRAAGRSSSRGFVGEGIGRTDRGGQGRPAGRPAQRQRELARRSRSTSRRATRWRSARSSGAADVVREPMSDDGCEPAHCPPARCSTTFSVPRALPGPILRL